MVGVSYITDNDNCKKAVIIDLKTIAENEEDVHDLIDMLIAESRRDDVLIDWEQAKNELKAAGRL